MDFFERWFGVSPDGGDGSLEVLWIGVIMAALVAFVFRRKIGFPGENCGWFRVI